MVTETVKLIVLYIKITILPTCNCEICKIILRFHKVEATDILIKDMLLKQVLVKKYFFLKIVCLEFGYKHDHMVTDIYK